MTEPIRGRVARLLSSRKLALNVGGRDGVRVGMYFDILDQLYEDILDPETGENLGSIQHAKVRVQVDQVQDRLCSATTFDGTKVNVGGGGASLEAIARLFAAPHWVTKVQDFKNRPDGSEGINESESYVKVGDTAIQIVPEVVTIGDVENPVTDADRSTASSEPE